MRFNPNEAGLFEGSFFWIFSQIDPQPQQPLPPTTTIYNCQKIYLEYVESEKILTSSVTSSRH